MLDPELTELLSAENLRDQGLTAEEIAHAPEIGIWQDRTDITNSVEYIENMRSNRSCELLKADHGPNNH